MFVYYRYCIHRNVFLLYQNNNDQLNIYSIVLFTSIFLIIAGLVYLLKPIFLEKKDLNEKFIKNYAFLETTKSLKIHY